jgi:hypothetical protein
MHHSGVVVPGPPTIIGCCGAAAGSFLLALQVKNKTMAIANIRFMGLVPFIWSMNE